MHRLGLAWEFKTGTHRVIEATPIVIDGVMITSGPMGRVWALDAASGRELWSFEPEVDMQVNRAACCDWANRGVAVRDGRVFTAALDGWLYALDAKTGKLLWKVDTIVDRGRGYTSTGAPEVAGNVVVIGNAGAEYDTRGYVTAYDVSTGREAWRFWTVPRDPKLGPQEAPYLDAALKTWSKDSRWDVGGGGTVWDAIVYDALTDTVFIGTGNGGPYNQRDRSPGGGDNLYLASVVALDAKTGAPRWHYQQTPGDSWDYTATQPMVLTDLEVDGVKRPVILHAPKNGFLYVLDRRDGKLLRAHKIVRANWASHVDLATGRPVFDPAGDYSQSPRIVFPAVPGAHNWHPMAWHPGTGLLYVPVLEMGNLMFRLTDGKAPRQARRLNAATAIIVGPDLAAALPGLPPPLQAAVKALPEWADAEGLKGRAFLRAIDPLTGRTAWQVERSSWADRAGVLSTAGDLRVPRHRRRLLERLPRAHRRTAQGHRHRHEHRRGADELQARRRAVRGRRRGRRRRRMGPSAQDQRAIPLWQCGAHPRLQARRWRGGETAAARVCADPCAAAAETRRHGRHHRPGPRAVHGQLRDLPLEPDRLERGRLAPHAGEHTRHLPPDRAGGCVPADGHAALGRRVRRSRGRRDPRLPDRIAGTCACGLSAARSRKAVTRMSLRAPLVCRRIERKTSQTATSCGRRQRVSVSGLQKALVWIFHRTP